MAENHQSDREQPAATPARGGFRGRLWGAVRVPCLILVLVVLAHWKLVLTNQYTWLDTPDIARQVLPWMQYQVGEIQKGRLPLWDPHSWGGQPLLAQAQPGTANPVNWLLFVTPTRHGWIRQAFLHWYYVLIHWVAALFFYYFLRSIACSSPAAILGGLVYTLGGFMNYVDWPQQKMGGLWTPLIFLYVFRALRGESYWRSIGLAGLFLGLSVLTGHHVAPLFVVLAVVAIWLWELFGREEDARRKLLTGLAVLGLVAGLVSAVQLLPAMEYSRIAVRWAGMQEPVSHTQPVSYSVHSAYGIQSFAILGTIVPGIHRHTNAFMGFLSVLLAISAVWGMWCDQMRGRAVRWLTCIAIGGLLFALAGETNLHGMLYAVLPMLEKARNPSHAVVLWSMGAAGLAGLGLDQLLRRVSLDQTRRLFVCVGLTAGALLWTFWAAYYAVKDGKVDTDARGVVVGFLLFCGVALVAGWQSGGISRRGLVAGFGVLLLAELGNGMAYQLPNLDSNGRAEALDQLPKDSELVAFLQKQPGLGRFQWNVNNHSHNISDLYGLETDGSFLASVSANIYRLGIWTGRGRVLMGTRYLMAPESVDGWNRLVHETPDGRKVWENAGVMPRLWTVHEVEGGYTRDQSRHEMELGSHDFRRWAFLEGPAPRLEQCPAPDEVHLLRRVSNRVEIYAEMGCQGMVVLSDTWYPGWVATVDGQPAEILEVYGALRGVVVAKGPHRVRMVFRPVSVYLGAGLTVLGLALAALLARSNGARWDGLLRTAPTPGS